MAYLQHGSLVKCQEIFSVFVDLLNIFAQNDSAIINVYINTHIHTHIHTHTYTHIGTYTYSYTHHNDLLPVLWCMQEVWGVSSKSLIQEAELKKSGNEKHKFSRSFKKVGDIQ